MFNAFSTMISTFKPRMYHNESGMLVFSLAYNAQLNIKLIDKVYEENFSNVEL